MTIKNSWTATALWVAFCFGTVLTKADSVLINELMYHPASENVREEYIELFNSGTNAVHLNGWRFITGVRFIFPDISIPPGGYLVVAADVAVFSAKYPGVTNVAGNWDGILSNSGQQIALEDAQGKSIDAIRYSDDGDWAPRVRDAIDYGHRGWTWNSEADGGGKSLELINFRLPNKHGQNWAASLVVEGTPGRANSVLATNSAPLILDVSHFPVIPRSTQSVAITARIMDEVSSGLAVLLHHRVDGSSEFNTTPMTDEGLNGDGGVGDGVWGGIIPPQTNKAVVEFYVEARDAEGNSRTWPAPVSVDGALAQTANALYQVDDSAYAGNQPLYRIIMKAADSAELKQINQNSPGAPYSTSDQTRSHSQFNATFVGIDGTGTELRYVVGIRNRGNGSRSKNPQGYRVNFLNEKLWKNAVAINLNSQYTHSQVAGSAIYRQAGIPTQESRAVQVRVNGENLSPAGAPSYGSYACNEVVNSQFAGHHFPSNSSGNLYRGIRIQSPGANLSYLGTNADPYRVNYFKQSNTSEDDWTDLIELTRVLDKTPDATYSSEIRRVVNVDEWMKYFAIETLVVNMETDLGNGNLGDGEGDDYFVYIGSSDQRASLIPYDLDTIMNQGDTRASTSEGLFRAGSNSRMSRFLKWPEFAPLYFRELKRQMDSVFAPEHLSPLLDQTIGDLAPKSNVEAMKSFMETRCAFVRSQIPLACTVDATLPVSSGYPRVTTNAVALSGLASITDARTVTVNGLPAAWSVWEGKWSMANVPLKPGINRILIQAFDGNITEIDRTQYDVWCDIGTGTTVGGTLSGSNFWASAKGPYSVTSALTVGSGATLVIEAGTSIYIGANVNITIVSGGRIVAEGTETAPIRFTRTPGSTSTWGGISLNGAVGSPETRLVHIYIEYNGSTAIHSSDGTLLLDHATFGSTEHQYVSLDSSSFVVSDCIFPTPTASFELAHGTGGIKSGGRGLFIRNFFGAPTGYNDVIDFTGGNRPGPIVEFINNVFTGTGDDILDLDGTDAWVEENIFMHVHKNGSPDSSSAVSGGNDSGQTSEVTIIGNLFYDCDQAAMGKQGNFFTLLNNTVVHQTHQGGLDTDGAVVMLADAGTEEGAGMYLEGNILYDIEKLTREVTAAVVTFTNNIMDLTWSGPGGGNSAMDPMFRHVPQLSETAFTSWKEAQIMRDWLSLQPGSPARGAAPDGRDLGGAIPLGAVIANGPTGTNALGTAYFEIGINRTGHDIPAAGWPAGSGFTHYKWRLDAGDWSAETPIGNPIVIADLKDGTHQIEVVGKHDSGLYQNDPMYGEDAILTHSAMWIVDSHYVPPAPKPSIRINEILARNVTAFAHGDSYPDVVELYNSGQADANLAGMSLATSATNHAQFLFHEGTVLKPGQYLVLYGGMNTNLPGLNLGFKLNQNGDSLYLLDTVAQGGGVLDSVIFGIQLADLSIGRLSGSEWFLTKPTPGAANVLQATAAPVNLKINEWLAGSLTAYYGDFVELYNPDAQPVALGGLYLADQPAPVASMTPITPLSFIGAGNYVVFKADAQPGKGANHAGFALHPEQGAIGLFDAAFNPIDVILYGPQTSDVSEGRSPNGSDVFHFFTQPTPGAGNPGSSSNTNVTTVSIPLVAMTNSWKYNQTEDLGTAWSATGYNDSTWPSGPALLYVTSSSMPAPTNTPLVLGRLTYYFRSHFQVNTNLGGASLSFYTVIDDGAIIYLNGAELFRVGMPSGAVTYSTKASRTPADASLEGPFVISQTNLVEGDNVLAVEVHQATATSHDIVFGLSMAAELSYTNGIDDNVSIQLNEVCASGSYLSGTPGLPQDWVELYNPSSKALDLAGFSLTDEVGKPQKWIFPSNSVVAPGGFFQIVCNDMLPASSTNTGFSLNTQGDAIFLFDTSIRGGNLRDSAVFGVQVPGLTLGRVGASKTWTLTRPSPGAANQAVTLGAQRGLKINEWMANPISGDDWFELYNPGSDPIDLSGLYLTDDLSKPSQFLIPPLSFIGAGSNGFQVFQADGSADKGPNHTNFKLNSNGESLGLFTVDQVQIDAIVFDAQQVGVSQGRYPDGSTNIVLFDGSPTPGQANSKTAPNPDTDGDGMPNDWEIAYGFNPNDPADAASDADGDGLINLQEYLAGTDPRDAQSSLHLMLEMAPEKTLKFSFYGVAGKTYAIERKTSANLGTWGLFQTIVPSTTGTVEISGVAADMSEQYYRIRLVP